MNLDGNTIFFMLLFSLIGMGYFNYGRKNNLYFMISGILLMVYTYFVSSLVLLIGIGVFLTAMPFILNWISPIP